MTRTGAWVSAVIVAAAVVLPGLLIAVTGGSPAAALRALIQGSLGDATAVSQTLLYAAPLLLVAVGACCSARSGAFNIGQEGQVLIGALAGAAAGLRLAVPGPALLVVVLLAAALAAGAWAWLSALMNRLRGVDIAVSTLLMTFLAQQVVAFAVTTPWLLQESRLGAAAALPQSNKLPSRALLGSLGDHPGLQLNLGLAVGIVVAVLVAVALDRTRWGFRLTMAGLNPAAARHAGISVTAVGGIALTVSGALAGLAGAVLLTSPLSTNRLQPDISINIGWDGLLVALVARNRPLLAIPIAGLFAVLRAGGNFLAATGVPPYLVDVVKALLTLAFVAPAVLRRRSVIA
ncbi:ABC transporter permease [Actinoplanes cyaneus]|uniref:ABC transporter permease n=1 Tax=Actinoplanes cyaneus TaxID=52696 RepID=A0A919M0C5_9ACTN|nr:ABC transporter permease [Actinoplanes cyaneus]MCW2137793.1 nucleoside ABC transporter membrane protein [Actinoplanes cyaneus]GID65000.1 ABC transporter permease [Actinoplanes cyaneus]